MTLQVTDSGRFTLVAPNGALVDAELGPLQGELDACLAAGRVRLVLDLGGVPFIDSRGLELLLEVGRRAAAAGGRLRLANPNPICSEILSATRVANELEVFFDLNQAGRSFR